MESRNSTRRTLIVFAFLIISANMFAQIAGPTLVCNGSAGNIYSVPAGGTGYTWAVSGGGIITAGSGTEAITVTWNGAGVWQVSVTYNDALNNVVVPLPLNVTVGPTITGPTVGGLPATLGNGATLGQVYTTEPGMTNYIWTVSPNGFIATGQGTATISVDWTGVASQQTVSVTYTGPGGCTPVAPTVMIINYYPYLPSIDPAIVPKFVDPMPHFAAGLRVNAKAGGNLLVKAALTQQVALSTGTVTGTGIIGDPLTPNAGLGKYAGYAISTDNGATFGPTMWPAQTIEAQQGFPLKVQYRNDLFGVTYDAFNILADQTLMMNGYALNGNPLTEPYRGDIPMVVHLHGGEIPSGSDGGPNAWFTPGYAKLGPAFLENASSLSTYPNAQEATTAWFHPHDDGLTRINVYTGLAGYYFIRGKNEEVAQLPGWSGDDKVMEVTPAGKTPTFNGTNTYLPEIEIAIQDRMFNTNGELYWPVAPTNPDIHPFWTPEFIGDIITVNGKTWPYLSVAPRKYRFRILEGCNARMLNMWLVDAADGVTPGPVITVIGGEGGLLASPQPLDPKLLQTLMMAPGQRYDVVIDFSGLAGKTFTLMNNANAPFPGGIPVVPGTTDRIMQFVVNGQMVSAANPTLPGADKSQLPVNLRPVTPLVQLTDFAGNTKITPSVHRQIILNEVTGAGGPASVLVNNTYYESVLSFGPAPYRAGGPTEFMREGTVEMVQIINTTADAHPIHIHLLQWQLVSRQTYDDVGYLNAYAAAWAPKNIPEFPAGLGYPGGAGTPNDYNIPNGDGAVGGNPAVTPFLTGAVMPANPEEMGWKDNVIVLPGQVTTFMVRVAPTEVPLNAPASQLLFTFDPSEGPGYVWHCHIVDHEDMSMMRPLPIIPSVLRYPQITTQPAPVTACLGDVVTYSVAATSATAITYQWQSSTDGGLTWANLANDLVYSNVTTATLGVVPSVILTGTLYHCLLTNFDGTTTSNAASIAVNACSVSGSLKYNNITQDPLAGYTVTINGLSAITDASGAFTIPGITSGTFPVTITTANLPGGINATDAGLVNAWAVAPVAISHAEYLAGDVDMLGLAAPDAVAIQQNFVRGKPFLQAPWVFANAAGTTTAIPPALTVTVPGSPVTGFNVHGMSTGDFNKSFNTVSAATVLLSASGNTLNVAAGKQFDLPINSTTALSTGAVSLVLNVPTTLVTVKNVKIPGSTGPLTWNVVGTELRVAWNSTAPVNVLAGGNLVVLTLMPTTAFTSNQTLTISMVANPLNEIADFGFMPMNATLTVDNVKVTAMGKTGLITLDAFPNPTTGATTITYYLPVDGTVTIGLYNSLGTLMQAFITAQFQTAGTYSLPVTVTVMKGTYYLTLTQVDNLGVTTTKTIKLIKK